MADQGSSTSTGATSSGTTSGYQRGGAHRGPGYEEQGPGYQERGTGYDDRGLRYEDQRDESAATAGRLLAAALMIVSGLVTFFDGIVGIIHGTFFPHVSNYAFTIGPTGRGITNLILGALIFAAGVSLLLGMFWARVVGVVLAVCIVVYNFLILPWYPLWAIILIALNVYIIWALSRSRRHRHAI
jgi:hypothetical protein